MRQRHASKLLVLRIKSARHLAGLQGTTSDVIRVKKHVNLFLSIFDILSCHFIPYLAWLRYMTHRYQERGLSEEKGKLLNAANLYYTGSLCLTMKHNESMFVWSSSQHTFTRTPSCPCSQTQEEFGHKMAQTSFPKPSRCPLILDRFRAIPCLCFLVLVSISGLQPIVQCIWQCVQRLPDKAETEAPTPTRTFPLGPWIHKRFVIAPAWHKALAAPLDDTPGTGQNIKKHRWSCDILNVCQLSSLGFCLYNGYVWLWL